MFLLRLKFAREKQTRIESELELKHLNVTYNGVLTTQNLVFQNLYVKSYEKKYSRWSH